ncbi:SLC13 family permease [Pontiella sulfatireligans]|uniref:Sodium-dependent dicarboxylate transporter SdcS n=1 Tax=Pontiella sulfatireligans TaxID=2750658 RepID=A0A6C2UN50_9BACT|nr:SLC13 family permease [Pontiella sulfatireligans]VGO20777.1 Sodium-dependent dicarboxylate transporter SdcS [Pontiella sulfatireligans]
MEAVGFSSLGWDAWFTMGTVVAVFLCVVLTRLSADTVFLGGTGLLMVVGVLDAKEALAGFSSSGMVTVGVLYVVVSGLQETGALLWISSNVLGRPTSVRGAQSRVMFPVLLLSGFLNNTPVVAMFIPMVLQWARRIGRAASLLLIPLSFASILGGMCTLIGTSTNLVVNGLYQHRYGGDGMGMFEITLLGLPCAVVGMAYLLLFSKKLLPQKKSIGEEFANPREYTVEMIVQPKSGLSGHSVQEAGLRQLPGGYLVEIIHEGHVHAPVAPSMILNDGDRLVFAGAVELILELRNLQGLQVAEDSLFSLDMPLSQRRVVEVVVSTTCPEIGQRIRECNFRERYNAAILALARNGERVDGRIGDMRLKAGDTLLIEAHAGFAPRQKDSRDFLLVSEMQDAVLVEHRRAPVAMLILAGMVLAVSFQLASMLHAAVTAAMLMLALKCSNPSRARKSVEWNVLLVIAAALGLGSALEKTGAAGALANSLIGLGGGSPWITLALVYVVTSIFTELITNNAAAALVFPVAMGVAESLGVDAKPFITCIMISASASFITPIGYQTNLMVFGPGGYRFADYLKIGLPLTVLVGVTAILLAPLIWPF